MATPTRSQKLSPDEEKALLAMEEEEAAKQAALQAIEATKVNPAKVASIPPTAPKTVGDVIVEVLRTEPFCRMGDRAYPLVKGNEIPMHPSHAEELQQVGIVIIRKK